jgi:competence protein ComEC
MWLGQAAILLARPGPLAAGLGPALIAAGILTGVIGLIGPARVTGASRLTARPGPSGETRLTRVTGVTSPVDRRGCTTGRPRRGPGAHERRGAPVGDPRHPCTPTAGGPAVPGTRLVVAGVLVTGLGLGIAVGAVHLARLQAGPLAEVVAESAVVRATVRITGDPRMHQTAPDAEDRARPAPTWTVPARLAGLQVRGRSMQVRVPVLLRGEAVRSVRFGAVMQVVGRAQPTWAPAEHAMVLRVLSPPQERSPPGSVARATTTIREAFRAACAGLPADAGALLLGLAVGDESTLPASLDEAMLRTGLSHLTAVSGSNTSLVVGLALALVSLLGLGWRWRILVAGLALAGYVALVRPQPSVLRAAAMGVVALVALGVGGRRRGAPALLVAVLVLLVALPQMAISLGFALSAAATAGLLVVGPPLADRMARWPATRWAPEPLRAALAVAAAAHLATLPLALLMGNGASWVALPANVLVTPLVPVATVLGLAAALLAPVLPPVAVVLAHVAAPATALIAWVSRTLSATPGAVVPVPGGPGAALGCVVVLGAAALVARGWRPWRDRRIRIVAVVGVAVGVLVRGVADARWPPADWLVLVCDVGQGDALLVRAPGSAHALLVDAGPDPQAVGACVRDAGLRAVTVLVTHFHADHVDGLSGAIGSVAVPTILTTPVTQPPEGVGRVLGAARAAGIPVRSVRAGEHLAVAGLDVRVLWPARAIEQSAANNGSVVALVATPGRRPLRVLVTGDVEPEAQAAVMALAAPEADVVKVPHHGSRHQHPAFADWTGAAVALVSVGRVNDYGHPSEETLQQYARTGAAIGRSDQHGSLAITLVRDRPQLWTQR